MALHESVVRKSLTSLARPVSQNSIVLPFPSPWALPNPGIKPQSPALQADPLPSEPEGKPPRQTEPSTVQAQNSGLGCE